MNANGLKKIDNILKEMTDTGYVSGVNCLITHEGKEVYYGESGVRDLESSDKFDRTTIVRLYSMSKPITAVAVYILIDEGKIDLLDPIEKYLPGFAEHYTQDGWRKMPTKYSVTIKDLLNMTSGVSYPGDGNPAEARSNDLMNTIIANMDKATALSTVDIANKMGTHPLAFEPGEKWQYGFSADILGALVEVVSNMSFGDFLKERIFNPLGMLDTDFYVPEDKQNRLAKVYDDSGKLKLFTYPNLGISNDMKNKPKFESGGAGLVSTVDDYTKFCLMLLNNGELNGVRILSKKAVEKLTSGGITPKQRQAMDWESLQGYTYGNLLRVLTNLEQFNGLGEIGEYGWDGWLGAYMSNDPVNNISIVLLIQRTNAGTTDYTRKIRNVLYSNL